MKQITIIAGILLTITGMWCFARPGEPFINLAFLFGAAMMMSATSNCLTWVVKRKTQQVSGYLLAEGVITLICSTIVLADQLIVDAVIPVFFGMWMIFSGMMRIMAALRWLRRGDSHWGWFFGFGLCTLLCGWASFSPAVTTAVSIISLLGVYFLLQGANMIVIGVHMRHRLPSEQKENGIGETTAAFPEHASEEE